MKRRTVNAHLTLLPPEAGGRSGSILSGYRSLARFEGSPTDFGFELTLEADELSPGSTGAGRLSFWAVDELPPLVRGLRFEILEGTKKVGYGELVDVSG